MIRFTVSLVIGLAIVVAASIWFSDRPGQVAIEWQGWLIELSVGRFVLAAAVALAILIFLYGVVRAVGGAPNKMRDKRRT